MRRNGQNSTSGEIFNPKFEILMGGFLFEYEFWWLPSRLIRILNEKRLSYCKIFRIWGLVGVGVTVFDESPKKHILG